MEDYEIQAHKELDNQIRSCKDCCPISKNEKYCDKCLKAITDFANKYGAGILTKDV